MSQLVKQSTAIDADSGQLPSSPSETALWNSLLDYSLPAFSLGPSTFLGPSDSASITASSDQSDQDVHARASSNISEHWRALQSRQSPYGISLYDLRDDRAPAERVYPRPYVAEPLFVVLDPASSAPTQNHAQSEGATATDDSVFLLEEQLINYLGQLVHEAADEVFSDGMESPFSRRLVATFETFGEVSIRAIARLIDSGSANAEVVGELLRQLGSIEDHFTHYSRLTILVNSLQDHDPRIRDAASLGIAALDNPIAIGAVRNALERESSPYLQRNLMLVLDQLQETKWQGS